MSEKCQHYWIPSTTNADGSAQFRMNRHMANVPLVHATCDLCNDRTWFTENQWNAIPAMVRPTEEGDRADNH